jgi:hypothetical protein
MEDMVRTVDPEAAERSLGPPSGSGVAGGAAGAYTPTAADYQLCLGVQRVRCPEVLFQPTLVGIDQVRPHGMRERVGEEGERA